MIEDLALYMQHTSLHGSSPWSQYSHHVALTSAKMVLNINETPGYRSKRVLLCIYLNDIQSGT